MTDGSGAVLNNKEDGSRDRTLFERVNGERASTWRWWLLAMGLAIGLGGLFRYFVG